MSLLHSNELLAHEPGQSVLRHCRSWTKCCINSTRLGPFPETPSKLSSLEPATTADARSDIDGGRALSHDGACNLIWSDSERIGDDGGGGDPGPLDERADESSEDYIEPDFKVEDNIMSTPSETWTKRSASSSSLSHCHPSLLLDCICRLLHRQLRHIHIESSWVGLVTLPAAVIDGDDDICDTATHAVYPVPHHSSPPSISSSSPTSSPLSSLRSSPASSPPPFTISSPRISLRGTSGNGPSYDGMYVGMDGPNKRKCRRTSCGAPHKATESSQLERPLTKAIEAVGTNDAAGEAFDGQVQKSNPELLHTGAEEATVLKGELPAASPPKAENACEGADLKNQVTSLEGVWSLSPIIHSSVPENCPDTGRCSAHSQPQPDKTSGDTRLRNSCLIHSQMVRDIPDMHRRVLNVASTPRYMFVGNDWEPI
ncbi:hypothetical protein DL95DRAFT_451338 [Leptodontidium sp. 2 PMI_412]|nr:hypothetical protein DL95DRAFT_451338 [Leptodontidium sp. 2 PMI_412]